MSGEVTAADAFLAELETVRAENERLRSTLWHLVNCSKADIGDIRRACEYALAHQAVAEQNRAAGRSERP